MRLEHFDDLFTILGEHFEHQTRGAKDVFGTNLGGALSEEFPHRSTSILRVHHFSHKFLTADQMAFKSEH